MVHISTSIQIHCRELELLLWHLAVFIMLKFRKQGKAPHVTQIFVLLRKQTMLVLECSVLRLKFWRVKPYDRIWQKIQQRKFGDTEISSSRMYQTKLPNKIWSGKVSNKAIKQDIDREFCKTSGLNCQIRILAGRQLVCNGRTGALFVITIQEYNYLHAHVAIN